MNKYIETSISYLLYAMGKPYIDYKQRKYPPNRKMRILVVRIDALGDMVVTSPFFRELRAAYPLAEITLVCSQYVFNLVEHCPYVDEVLACPMKRYAKHLFLHRLRDCMMFAQEKFHNRCFDLAICPMSYINYPNAWIIFFSGSFRRIAYYEEEHDQYMGSCNVYFTERIHQRAKHEVESTLDILRFLHQPVHDDSLEVWLSEKDKKDAMDLISRSGVAMKRKKIVVSLTTSHPSKDWPVEDYVAVCKQLQSESDVEFLLVGAGDTAVKAATQFCINIPEAHDFTNKTTIRETVAIMKLSDLHLGGDTGTAHIAAACGLKGVVIYSSVRLDGDVHVQEDLSQWFAPWHSPLQIIQPKHALPGCERGCKADRAHCIKQVSVPEVLKALEKVI